MFKRSGMEARQQRVLMQLRHGGRSYEMNEKKPRSVTCAFRGDEGAAPEETGPLNNRRCAEGPADASAGTSYSLVPFPNENRKW
jgi:hypothetical protein